MSEEIETTEEMVEETTTAAPEEAIGADLNINDLSAMKAIIDIASARGVFKPNEMVTVGQTYNKLSAFLEQVSKQVEEANQNG
jgi:hypothetical protein